MSVFTNPASGARQAADAYVRATLDLLGDREPVTVLRETPDVIRDLVNTHRDDQLRRPEAPGKWSVAGVIQHLADSDLVWAVRLRMTLTQDRPTLAGFDQDAWAERFGYDAVTPSDALARFTVLRGLNLSLVTAISPGDLQRVSVHEERGEERLERMLRLYAGHDLVHLNQIRRIVGSTS